MNPLQEIAPQNRGPLTSLFTHHKRQRVIIDAMFDFPFGKTLADSPTHPEVAILRLGIFTLLGGNPNHPAVPDLLKNLSQTLIIPETEPWPTAISNALEHRPPRPDRWGFSPNHLNIDHARTLSQQIPHPYEIQPIHGNKDLARQTSGATAYASEPELLQNGIGFCVLSGEHIVGSALSYTNSRTGIEINITIDEPHRRKGLATAAGAALTLYCLEHNITPHWNAANQNSANLAQKLGYTQNDHYHPFRLLP